jgi:hypothetical protein
LPFVAQVGKNCQSLVGEVVIEIVDARCLPRGTKRNDILRPHALPKEQSCRRSPPDVFQVGVLHGDDTVSPSVAAL